MQIKRRLITVNFVTPQINSWFFFIFFLIYHLTARVWTNHFITNTSARRAMRPAPCPEPSSSMWCSYLYPEQQGAREVLKHRVIGGVVTWLHLLILALEDREYPEAWITRANLEPQHISLWYTLQTQWVHRSSSWHMAALIQLLAGCPI